MRARFYIPEIRRFVNQDILLGDIGEGQTLNRYAFVTGQPVSFVDPFGLKTTVIITTDPFWLWILPILYDSHAAVMVDNNGDPVLYDPNGTYVPPDMIMRGEEFFTNEFVNLSDYLNYHSESGSTHITLIYFFTTYEQEQEIVKRIYRMPKAGGLECATYVTSVLDGIGPFENLADSIPLVDYLDYLLIGVTPGFLRDELLNRQRNE